ncbi:hypothetical protein M5C99_09145 [Acidovorax sp. NCPPB 2350]|nr:hypothetical protein M5C99_09145 [Acidovorax sp. NCPPB 2350]
MIVNIDFSIFKSPVAAYGNITGEISVSDNISIGDGVVLLSAGGAQGLTGLLKVISIIPPKDDSGKVLLGLDDVILNSESEASILAQKLEVEVGLFFDQYF